MVRISAVGVVPSAGGISNVPGVLAGACVPIVFKFQRSISIGSKGSGDPAVDGAPDVPVLSCAGVDPAADVEPLR